MRGRALPRLRHASLCVLALMASGVAAGTASAAELPDGRAYELVSPGDNADVEDVSVLPFIRQSDSGDSVAFQSLGDLRTGRDGKVGTYLARRGASGWSSSKLTPPSVAERHASPNLTTYSNIFFRFTGDLSKAVYVGQPSSPLVAGEPANKQNAYLRDNTTGSYQLITDRTPAPLRFTNDRYGPTRVAWTSSDLSQVLFDSEGSTDQFNQRPQYFPGVTSQSVYAWNQRDGMSIASVLPDGRFATSAVAGSPPRARVSPPNGFQGDAYGGTKNAVSDDGSRIFFTANFSNLYVRKNHGTPQAATERLDDAEPGSPPALGGDSVLQAASNDGHRALFTSCNRLTSDSNAVRGSECRTSTGLQGSGRPELYLHDEDANGGAGDLIDLTPQDPAGADVVGILGATDDLSRIYFAARGNLTSDIPAARPQDRVSEQDPKVYVWDENDGVRFVARMRYSTFYFFRIRGDVDAYQPALESPSQDAAMSEDGNTLAWGTYFPVDPNFNNVNPNTQDLVKQVYTYDYASRSVKCASCVGAGPARSEASIAPQRLIGEEARFQNYPDYRRRNVVAGGREVYFESGERLIPEDQNSVADVYQYRTDTGQLALISSGTTGDNSNFVGATEDGNSVFFRTTEGLVNSDRNQINDLYVARRESTVPNNPAPPLPCADGCPAPPATSTFPGGPGNVPPPALLRLSAVSASQRKSFAGSGRLALRLNAPAAGTLKARLVAQFGKKLKKTAGSASVTARGAGVVTVRIRLSSAARRQLARTRKLGLRLEVTFGTQKRVTRFTLTKPKPKPKRSSKSAARR